MKNIVLLAFALLINFGAFQLHAQLSVIIHAPDSVCPGQGNVIATAIATGGSGYTYHWSNGATGPVDSTLDPGYLGVTVTDNASQTATASALVAEDFFNFTLTILLPACDSFYGSAHAVITQGTGIFYFRWSNGDSGSSVYSLAPGNYSLTITDTLGCSLSDTFMVRGDTSIIAHVSATGSSGNNGTASVTVVQGLSPYWYEWSNGDTTAAITSLQPGVYRVTISDGGGCMDTLAVMVPNLTGISNINLPGFSIYPNPANDYAYLTISEPCIIEIWDATGKRLNRLEAVSGKVCLDLRDYPPGNYLIRAENESYRKTVELGVVR